jgi:hypothetical protein
MWFTRTGKLHIIRPQAIFKQVTGWYFDSSRPKTEAPTVCNHPPKRLLDIICPIKTGCCVQLFATNKIRNKSITINDQPCCVLKSQSIK